MHKLYLGDGVYVEVVDRGLKLTAENGIEATDTIWIESEVYNNLIRYVENFSTRSQADGYTER